MLAGVSSARALVGDAVPEGNLVLEGRLGQAVGLFSLVPFSERGRGGGEPEDRSQRRRWALYVPMSVVLVCSRARLPHEVVGRWAGRDPSDNALSPGKPVPACTGHS